MKHLQIYCSLILLTSFNNTSYAADNIISPEPDNLNYVRICDTYGKSYFTIPGTQTCLSLGGYVRTTTQVGHDPYDNTNYKSPTNSVRFTFNTKTASETELGTLKTDTSLRFQWDDGNDGKGTGTLRKAIIQLGGLQIGLDFSTFVSFSNYLGNIINDDVIAYGGTRTAQISYIYKSDNGFSALLALEQGSDKDSGYNTKKDDDTSLIHGGTIKDYVPHVIAGVKYEQGWGAIATVAAYDSVNRTWAGKTRLDLKVSDALSLWIQSAYKNNEDIYFDGQRQKTSFYGQWGGDWVGWGGFAYQLNAKASLNTQVGYDASKTLAAAINVEYQILPGLTIQPEFNYTKWNDERATALNGKQAFGGTLLIQRTF